MENPPSSGKTSILVIDDEVQIRRFLRISLELHGYTIYEAADATEGIKQAIMENPSIIILDLGLPDEDGVTVLHRIREWSMVPIIILSVKNDELSIVNALESGADDYLTKPFKMRELLARIHVCLRRNYNPNQEPIFRSGELVVDLSNRLVTVQDKSVKLTATEYDLLKAFVRHSGKVLTHQQLLKEVWGTYSNEHTESLRVYVGHLRSKLEKDPKRPKLILTEPGVGYRLEILGE